MNEGQLGRHHGLALILEAAGALDAVGEPLAHACGGGEVKVELLIFVAENGPAFKACACALLHMPAAALGIKHVTKIR
jgi:hypothetical protein